MAASVRDVGRTIFCIVTKINSVSLQKMLLQEERTFQNHPFWLIHLKDTTVINIYSHKNRASKCMRQKLTDSKRKALFYIIVRFENFSLRN